MSQENVEVVRQAYERFGRDLAAAPEGGPFLDLFDPEVHLDQTRRILNPATYDGHDGLLQALSEVPEAWERFSLEPERFIDAGDVVVVLETALGVGRGSGVEIRVRSGSVYTLRDGRILRIVVYPEPAEAMRAAGLRPGS
jgi:ketosteroid isomerase-like protein